MIYDYQGNALSKAFDYAGNNLQIVYSAYGESIHLQSIDNNTDNIIISDVVSYYQNKVQEITALVNKNNSHKISFILLSDTHGRWNDNNSQNIIRYLLKYSKADKLFWLGDMVAQSWEQGSFEEFDNYFASLSGVVDQIYMTIGNHETYYNITDLSHLSNAVLSGKTNIHGDISNFYYYFDDTDHKIRYLVLNTSDEISDNYVSSTQIEWIKSSVQELTEDWFVALFSHIPLYGGSGSSEQSAEVVAALEITKATIIGHFCGHTHKDDHIQIDKRLHEIWIEKDFSNAAGTTPERVSGTYTEHSVSIVTVDLKNRTVDVNKIGYGKNMAYEF